MYRTECLFLVLALAATARAQDASTPVKQPADVPPFEDKKTAPLVYPEEKGSVAESGEMQASSPRRERVEAAAGPVRRPLPFPMFDVDEHGTHWVRGATYKASFGTVISGGTSSGGTAATYIPFLGSRAPRNFPVTMRVASITTGGVPLELDTDVEVSRDGTTITLDHGCVAEQYLIQREGMEQRFVFDALPSRGEIVVTLGIETELVGRATADGLRFENEHGHASYGKALAFDGLGSTCAVEERFEQGRIQLVVPADFVAKAVLPLVIDPFQSTFTVDAGFDDDSNADVAFVTQAQAALVVYENAFSATDHDVYGEKYVDQVWQSTVVLDSTTTNWRNPRVAGSELSHRFLCVVESGVEGARIIRGRGIDAHTLGAGTAFTINGPESGDKHSPDVGGDVMDSEPTYFCVVWQRDASASDTDIHGRLVASTGTAVSGGVIPVDNSGSTLDSRPSISKTCGRYPWDTQDWTVVWQHEASPTNDDVHGARIHWNGNITATTFTVAGTPANERFPTASEPLNLYSTTQPRLWLAVFTIDADLRFRAFDVTTIVDTLDLPAGPSQSLGAPDVTSDGRLWQVAFTHRSNTFPLPDSDVRAASLSCVAGSLHFAEASSVISASDTETELRPRIASTIGSTNPYRSYIAYDRTSDTTSLDVRVGVYDSPVNAGGFSYCLGTNATCPCSNGGSGSGGCASSANPNGAVLTAFGRWFVSSDATLLIATGMPQTAPALFFQGTAQSAIGTTFGDGLRCATGTIRRLATKTSVGGSAQFPGPNNVDLHVAGAVPGVGGWRYYQVWYRNIAPFCSASTFNLTNGVALLWAP